MNKVSYVLNAVLIAVVIWLLMRKPGEGGEQQEVIRDTIVQTIPEKVYYVNTDTLWDQYLLIRDMVEETAAQRLRLENRYKQKIKAFEKDYKDFQEKARYMTPEEGQKKQQELMQKEQELVQFEKDLNREFTDGETKRNEKIREKLNELLKEYSEKNGYTYVLSRSAGGIVLHADSSRNITFDVLKVLNERYEEENTEKQEN